MRIESLVWSAQCTIAKNGTLVYLPGVLNRKATWFGWTDQVKLKAYLILRKSMAIFSYLQTASA